MLNQVRLWMKGDRKNTRTSTTVLEGYDADPGDGYCLACSLTVIQGTDKHPSGIH